jgi:hypothetical protein
MPRKITIALAACLLASCGGGAITEPPKKAPLVDALHQWVRSAQGHDAFDFCARTFMVYDTASSLWPRLHFDEDLTPGPTAPPSRVRGDCLEEFASGGTFDPALPSGTRIVAIQRIDMEPPVRDGGGITRTARVQMTTRHHRQRPVESDFHVVLYRGRWRVLEHNG